jgi:hypothetical protein
LFFKGVRPFSDDFISPKLLEVFLKQPELIIEKRNLSENDVDHNMMLYEYGVESDYFVIILDGSAVLEVGKDSYGLIEINAGLFSYYGVNALVDEGVRDAKQLFALMQQQQAQHSTDTIATTHSAASNGLVSVHSPKLGYKPEFSLKVNSYCVYMKITREDWLDVVKKSHLLKVVK